MRGAISRLRGPSRREWIISMGGKVFEIGGRSCARVGTVGKARNSWVRQEMLPDHLRSLVGRDKSYGERERPLQLTNKNHNRAFP